jgi:predicted deacetylase
MALVSLVALKALDEGGMARPGDADGTRRLNSVKLVAPMDLGIKDWIMEDMWDIKRVPESQRNTHKKVEVPIKAQSRSLISCPARSLGPLFLQIDLHDASDLRFG